VIFAFGGTDGAFPYDAPVEDLYMSVTAGNSTAASGSAFVVSANTGGAKRGAEQEAGRRSRNISKPAACGEF
jgi:hypothetical protein